MAIDNLDVVDVISIDAIGDVVLRISDHWEWTDSRSHQKTLQTKINRYLAFVESGEILDGYPNASNRQVAIEVVLKEDPDEEGLRFFENVKIALSEAGFSFRWRLLS